MVGCFDVRINKTKKSISVRIEDSIKETDDIPMLPIKLVHEISVKVQEHIEQIREGNRRGYDSIFECGYFKLQNKSYISSCRINNSMLQRVYKGDETVFSILVEDDSGYIGTLINCAFAELDSISDCDNFIEQFGLEKFMKISSIMYIYKLLCCCKWWKNNKSDGIKSEFIDFAHDADFLNEQDRSCCEYFGIDREISTAEEQMFSLDLLGAFVKKFDGRFEEMKKISKKHSEWANVISLVKKKVLADYKNVLREFEHERTKQNDENQKGQNETQVEGFWDPYVASDDDNDEGNIPIWPV